MASFKCSGCGRTDFFTPHGFAKHGRKCKGMVDSPTDRRSSASPLMRIPAWEKVKGTEYDASDVSSGTTLVKGSWVIYAYASDYNSRQSGVVNGPPYIARGAGTLTGRDLLAHAKKVISHANKQGAERFFEFFKLAKQGDGSTLIVMLFGS